jgi:large subunit ribosomal protein L5
MTIRLQQLYNETAVPKLREQFSYQNIHEVPKVVKVTINRGLGEAAQNAKALENSLNEIAVITGQRPVVTRAKKAIAGFKIRQGMPVGIMVTLRRDRMYAFLDEGTTYFPRSELRQRRSNSRDGYFYHHHCKDG